jgi:tetratricopeptide (TPR) repeat protein
VESVKRSWIISLVFCFATTLVTASEAPQQPLSRSELLALVAGGALGENIVLELKERAIGFTPTERYYQLLRQAGAGDTVLAAVKSSKANSHSAATDDKLQEELLQHLACAGEFIRDRKYSDASRELNGALAASLDGPEAPFVMGELLRRQEEWRKAAAVYLQLQRKNPEFPQIDTKLAYIFFRLGEQEEAISRGKADLVKQPENAEAHKNIGLALEFERKFDASAAEYREALRIKPDYSNVHFEPWHTFRAQG